MAKFLHLADLHLGYHQYNSLERQRDFFFAFRDIIERYALPGQVDFVLIAGDFFDSRIIHPATMNQAVAVLDQLRKAEIPVLVIEGNHDSKPFDNSANWLSFLAGIDQIILLEPTFKDGKAELKPWDPKSKRGAYIELHGLRIIGARWYGSSTARAIPIFVEAIRDLPPADYTIQMLHLGLEGYINENAGGLSYEQIKPLQDVVDYLAIGHFHKCYTLDNWVFNPGSPEACSVLEAEHTRGFFRVTVQNGRHTVEHIRDYYSRPFVRFKFDISRYPSALAAESFLVEHLRTQKQTWSQPPVVELALHGQISYKRHELDVRKLEKDVRDLLGALVVLVKYEAIPADLPVAPDIFSANRHELEYKILRDLLTRHSQYKEDAEEWAGIVSKIKTMALSHQVPEEIYNYLHETGRFNPKV